MFWKKKRNNNLYIVHDKPEKRSAFRYAPSEEKRLKVTIDNHDYKIENISATGLAFNNIKFKEGETHPIRLELPGKGIIINTTITIHHIDSLGICHCEFINPETETEEDIHQFIFERQMMDIRNRLNPSLLSKKK